MPNRRFVLTALAIASIVASGQLAQAESSLTVQEAYRKAAAGQVTLIDIRRPDEWAETGSGKHANRLDMRREDFDVALDKLVSGRRDAPIALICARGVRSNRLSLQLRALGYTNIIDVPEGMLGSSAGEGWIAQGLPLSK
jgi:rhodanese-related sulfurtransferase